MTIIQQDEQERPVCGEQGATVASRLKRKPKHATNGILGSTPQSMYQLPEYDTEYTKRWGGEITRQVSFSLFFLLLHLERQSSLKANRVIITGFFLLVMVGPTFFRFLSDLESIRGVCSLPKYSEVPFRNERNFGAVFAEPNPPQLHCPASSSARLVRILSQTAALLPMYVRVT